MKLRFVRIQVDDQDKALAFYTDKLGFSEKADIMMGKSRFLTVAAPDGIDGVQLILESADAFPPAQVYQKKQFEAGIPALSINTDTIEDDYARLAGNGVEFTGTPEDCGPIICTSFSDTCGNLVFLVQEKPRNS